MVRRKTKIGLELVLEQERTRLLGAFGASLVEHLHHHKADGTLQNKKKASRWPVPVICRAYTLAG